MEVKACKIGKIFGIYMWKTPETLMKSGFEC